VADWDTGRSRESRVIVTSMYAVEDIRLSGSGWNGTVASLT
jgi:hypothetical protein